MTTNTLSRLKLGQESRVREIIGSQVAAKRLADLGFVPGVALTMVRPGKPCIVCIQGRYLGLGDAHQKTIRLDSA